MSYQPFHMSRIGASHVRRDRPCQDASASKAYNGAVMAIVADGHGSRRHFRSQRGSEAACRVTAEAISAFLDEVPPEERFDEARINALKQAVCDGWRAAVLADHEQFPWTDTELEEQRGLLSTAQLAALEEGADVPIAYGSTICAVFAFEGGWVAIQLGDGSFVHIAPDGVYDWPMPESLVNEGNLTASLCMRDPMRDFRHCSGKDCPAGLLVYTDGIEKVFPPQGKEVISLLHWIWRNAKGGAPERDNNLARTLDMLTQRSPIGDDLSVAGLVDPQAEDAEPKPGKSQRRQEKERLLAQIGELENTIEYNAQRLRRARCNAEDIRSGAVEQLEEVLRRSRASEDALWAQMEALGEPVSPRNRRDEQEMLEPEDADLEDAQDPRLPEDGLEDAFDEDPKREEVSLDDDLELRGLPRFEDTVQKFLEAQLRRFWRGQ